MKTFNEICADIKERFYKISGIDIKRFSVFDMFTKSISYVVEQVYETIEKNKKPYLFTEQKGDELDSTGYFLSCPREDGESDDNYFYRLSNWTKRNASCNRTAIEDACKVLKYSTGATYVPYTMGIGTATIYLIPLDYSKESIDMAINEAKEQLSHGIVNPSSVINYTVPEPKYVKLVAYIDIKTSDVSNVDTDLDAIKNEIVIEFKKYINSIPPGERLMLGELNRMALAHKNVEYFNVMQIHLNGDEYPDFEVMQEVNSKFIFDEIIWWEVDK